MRQESYHSSIALRGRLFASLVCAAFTTLLLSALLLSACSLGAPGENTSHPVPSSTPDPLRAASVYWTSGLYLSALGAADGRPRWHVGAWTIPAGAGASYINGPGVPVMSDGTLYGGGDHAAYAWNARDGSVRWRRPVDGCANEGTPAVAGGVVYISVVGHDCAPSGWIYALRASDGGVLWRHPLERLVGGYVVVADGVVVVGSSTYPAYDEQFFLSGLRASDGALLWRVSTGQAFVQTPVALNGVVYLLEGPHAPFALEARRASDGSLVWRTMLEQESGLRWGPILADGMLLLGGDDGSLAAYDMVTGALRWRTQAATRFTFAPAGAGDRLYLGDGPTLDVLDAATGGLVRRVPVLNPPPDCAQCLYALTTPAIAGNVVFVGADLLTSCGMIGMCAHYWPVGTLYGLDTERSSVRWHYQPPYESAWGPGLTPVFGP